MLLKEVLIPVQFRIANFNFQTRGFQKTVASLVDIRWRKENRLTKNLTAFGPLTNMPDYSFKDGRPAPFGVRQMIRINKQRDYFAKIKTLTQQIDYAVEKHKKMEDQEIKEKQRIIENKLKPKGVLLGNITA